MEDSEDSADGPSSFSHVSEDWLQECEMTIMIPTDRDRLQQFSPFRMISLNHTTPESLYNGRKIAKWIGSYSWDSRHEKQGVSTICNIPTLTK